MRSLSASTARTARVLRCAGPPARPPPEVPGCRAIAAWQYPSSAVTPAGPAKLPGPEEMDERTCDDLRTLLREVLEADADRVEVEAGRGPAASVLLAAAARTGERTCSLWALVVWAASQGCSSDRCHKSVSNTARARSSCFAANPTRRTARS